MNDLKLYDNFFNEILQTISSARYEAYKSLNKHHTGLNFEIGKLIVKNQEVNNWGKSIVETLSTDINNATDKMAWSRSVLLNQIKANAYQNHLINPKQSNFENALPVHLSEQASEALKSEYNLDFLGINKPVLERELENRLIENIRDLLLELGYGFSFIGNQYRLRLNQKEYFIDLLFYHRILKCLVAIELKTVEFEPEFAGKMNFYLELLDEQEKQPDDNPSIGIILCPTKDNIEVEYSLRTNIKPIGVAEYKLTHELPKQLKGKVPTEKELKRMLKKAIRNAGDSAEDKNESNK